MSKIKRNLESKNIWIMVAIVLILILIIELSRSSYLITWNDQLNKIERYHPDKVVHALSGEEKEEMATIQQRYAIIHQPGHPYSDAATEHVEQVMSYMKKSTQLVPVTELASFNPASYDMLIITSPDVTEYWGLTELIAYVQDGGDVFFTDLPARNDQFHGLYRFLGMYDYGEWMETTGVSFAKNILLNMAGTSFQEAFLLNVSLNVYLDKETEVWMTSNDNIPLLWHTPYGEGSFTVFNGQILQEKLSRGLIAGTLSFIQPDFIYPILNAKIMYLDDFPAPYSGVIDRKNKSQQGSLQIYDHYGRAMTRFIKEIWWPDIIAMGDRYNLKYTSVFIQSYQNQVEPPFSSPVDENMSNLVIYGRDILKQGGEIGLHGYNHQSLVTSKRIANFFDYKSWKSEAEMSLAIKEALQHFRRSFPDYAIQTYVPPSNALDETGRDALKASWPELTNIASLYNEDYSRTAYIQEYEVAEDGLIELPRLTSGFENSEFNQWSAINGLTTIGIFSHFFHPDDITDFDHRNAERKSWDDLKADFEAFISLFSNQYPWLNPMTSAEAAIALEKHLETEVYFHQTNERIQIYLNDFSEQQTMTFILRTDKEIREAIDCTVQKIDDQTYLVETTKAKSEIKLVVS
ncbi:DUF2194 domain-containing protein [Marinicrinis sediminis]|uniref:DUF2194 domain-containing protein n=1 Tax=Marinicrinis sediminis TaxID=1652465 RepID=A0ABW5R9D0_9BACL